MIIFGIDPGIARLGWGVIKKSGRDVVCVAYGCITTTNGPTTAERLVCIEKEMQKLYKKFKPDAVGIEELFFAKNAKTAFQVGHARGVILLVAQKNHTPIREFTPLQVKQAMTGYGRADKAQMQRMVKIILKLDALPKPDDAADALAIAITCASA